MDQEQLKPFSFQDVNATKKIFKLRKRIRAVTGGTAASKTISILIWLIDYCQSSRNKIASVVSESYPHLSGGAIRDFMAIMKDRGYWEDSLWNKTQHFYTFETGSVLEFISIDTYGKAHGPRRDILFINECNNLSYNIVDQLITRTRDVVWLDWNPINEFWFYTEMLEKRDDLDFITLTYLDNEALDERTKSEILSHKNNKQWWTVYGLGKLGILESRIYKNWQIINSIPDGARLERYGLDFGFTNDPTVIIAIYKFNEAFILDEITYLKGLSNKSIADILSNSPHALCVADSADPKSIDEIRNYGVNIIGAQKGQGSVNQGIQFVQDQIISITSRSVNTIKAYRNYIWITDKNGKIINEPDDTIHEWSNPMDALRYGLDSYRPKKKTKIQKDFGGVNPYIEGIL